MHIVKKIFNTLMLLAAASCIPAGLNADALPEVVTTNYTSTTAASSNVLKYRGSMYWYKGGLRGIGGSRVYSNDSSRNITYNPQEPSGKTWMISGTWQWATNGLDVSRVVFNDRRPADFYKAEVVSGHVLIDNEALLESNAAFSNAVVAIAGDAPSGDPPDYSTVSNLAHNAVQRFEGNPVFDFSTTENIYIAISNLIHICGGSVTNFPSGQSWTINTNGTVTTEGELNPDGTVTIDGTLNPDGTVTVEAQ